MKPLALVIENDAGTRKLLNVLLTRVGMDVDLVPTGEVEQHPYIATLGPDVLDARTTPAIMRKQLEDRRFRARSLGSLVLDQRFAAGLGNYLRSDILFVAGLRASAKQQDLDGETRKKLARAILDV